MRTFHSGGTATTQSQASSYEAKVEGTVQLLNVSLVKGRNEWDTAMVETVKSSFMTFDGIERDRHSIPYGSKVFIKDGAAVKVGSMLIE